MPIVISNASADERFRDHPALRIHGIHSYVAVPLLRRDGSRFGVLCAADPLPTEVDPGVVRIFTLLAELISYEMEAVEQREQREAIVLSLQETVKLREELLAIIGHDLRTPLTAITLATAMMQTSASAAEIRELSASITLASTRMARLLDTLLDFTRSRLGGGVTISPRPADLGQLVERVAAEVAIANPGRDIRIEASGDLTGQWDVERVVQAFTNLVSNAVKYSPDASVVNIRLEDCDDLLRVEIRNVGELIENADTIFEPFQRGKGRHHGDTEGLGLGLYIVRQIVTAHGGVVSARASAEEGNMFRVDLPRVPQGGERDGARRHHG